MVANHVLFQLSYSPGLGSPSTSDTQTDVLFQLSYSPRNSDQWSVVSDQIRFRPISGLYSLTTDHWPLITVRWWA